MKKTLLVTVLFIATIIGVGQIPPGYYDDAEGLSGDQLKQALHQIIDDHDEYSYDDLRDFILKNTDEDPNNPNNVILLYTGRSQPKSTFGGGADDWNREHVWAKSHGDFGNSAPCGTDAHHIRPTDASVNSSRGNLDFDDGGQQHDEATGCYFDDDSWEPRDEVKGDVARMIFYMAVRYEGGSGEPDLEVVDEVDTYPDPEHGKLTTLLEWHTEDPPDTFEMDRHEVIFDYQANRNPFIDHPEYAESIWGTSSASPGEKDKSILIYPLPVENRLNIHLQGNYNYDQLSFHIFNAGGQLMEIDKSIHSKLISMDVEEYPKGLYILTIKQGDGKPVINNKFIK
ncbi:MAG: endonuclease [Bacteroidales bacterium]|nr:endonuclease [Bacteroidales bacterium]